MDLDPPQIESLHAAVVGEFDAGGLAQLARFKLGKPLDTLVNTQASTKQVAFDLIEYYSEQNVLGAFVKSSVERVWGPSMLAISPPRLKATCGVGSCGRSCATR